MIDVVGDGRLRNDEKKKRIRGIVVDVISGRKEKKEMRYYEDESSVSETIRGKKDKNNRIDDAAVKGDCDCY